MSYSRETYDIAVAEIARRKDEAEHKAYEAKEKFLSIHPCIHKYWKEYTMRFKFGESIYNIKVKNPNRKNTGVEKILLNGSEVENKINLDGSGKIFSVEVIM